MNTIWELKIFNHTYHRISKVKHWSKNVFNDTIEELSLPVSLNVSSAKKIKPKNIGKRCELDVRVSIV